MKFIALVAVLTYIFIAASDENGAAMRKCQADYTYDVCAYALR